MVNRIVPYGNRHRHRSRTLRPSSRAAIAPLRQVRMRWAATWAAAELGLHRNRAEPWARVAVLAVVLPVFGRPGRAASLGPAHPPWAASPEGPDRAALGSRVCRPKVALPGGLALLQKDPQSDEKPVSRQSASRCCLPMRSSPKRSQRPGCKRLRLPTNALDSSLPFPPKRSTEQTLETRKRENPPLFRKRRQFRWGNLCFLGEFYRLCRKCRITGPNRVENANPCDWHIGPIAIRKALGLPTFARRNHRRGQLLRRSTRPSRRRAATHNCGRRSLQRTRRRRPGQAAIAVYRPRRPRLHRRSR